MRKVHRRWSVVPVFELSVYFDAILSLLYILLVSLSYLYVYVHLYLSVSLLVFRLFAIGFGLSDGICISTNLYHRSHVGRSVCTCAPIFSCEYVCVCICICTISLERFVFAPVDTLLPLKINFFFDRDINIIMFKVYSFFSFSPFFSFSRSCHCFCGRL